MASPPSISISLHAHRQRDLCLLQDSPPGSSSSRRRSSSHPRQYSSLRSRDIQIRKCPPSSTLFLRPRPRSCVILRNLPLDTERQAQRLSSSAVDRASLPPHVGSYCLGQCSPSFTVLFCFRIHHYGLSSAPFVLVRLSASSSIVRRRVQSISPPNICIDECTSRSEPVLHASSPVWLFYPIRVQAIRVSPPTTTSSLAILQ